MDEADRRASERRTVNRYKRQITHRGREMKSTIEWQGMYIMKRSQPRTNHSSNGMSREDAGRDKQASWCHSWSGAVIACKAWPDLERTGARLEPVRVHLCALRKDRRQFVEALKLILLGLVGSASVWTLPEFHAELVTSLSDRAPAPLNHVTG